MSENQGKQMTLSQCAAHDKATNARNKLTGWGIICKERQRLGISRSQRVRANKLKRAQTK